MYSIISLLVLAVFTSSSEATVCKLDSDCAANQCCYIKPQFMVVSKRQSILPVLQPTVSDTGICENYRVEHENCGPLETANGHCGCGSGFSCQFVPADTVAPITAVLQTAVLQSVSRRSEDRSIYMPGPGTFQCEAV